jgi:uncharacterized protein (DUF697 family)
MPDTIVHEVGHQSVGVGGGVPCSTAGLRAAVRLTGPASPGYKCSESSMVDHQDRAIPLTGDADERRAEAMAIVRHYVLISAGAGLITLPVLDVSVLAGVHVALIKALSDFYGIEFSDHTARNIVIAIGASLVPGTIGSILGRRLLSVLPFVTPPLALASMSGASAFVSYSLGRIFIEHFEAGGTLQNFDVAHLHQVLTSR